MYILRINNFKILCLTFLIELIVFYNAESQPNNKMENQYIFSETINKIGDNFEDSKDDFSIATFDVDSDGDIYILEHYNPRISVFSKEGDKLCTFGRKGQGPGEFLQPTSIAVCDSFICISDVSRRDIQILNKSGEYIHSFKNPQDIRVVMNLKILDNKILFTCPKIDFQRKSRSIINRFLLSGLRGDHFKELFKYVTLYSFRRVDRRAFGDVMPVKSKKSFFIVDANNDYKYRILVFSNAGEKINEINRPYMKKKVSDKMRRKIEDYKFRFVKGGRDGRVEVMGKYYKVEISFPEFVPAIKAMTVDGDKLLVQTWWDWWEDVNKEKEKYKQRFSIDIFSTEGDYLGKGVTNLDLTSVIFHKDRVYEHTLVEPYLEPIINIYKR